MFLLADMIINFNSGFYQKVEILYLIKKYVIFFLIYKFFIFYCKGFLIDNHIKIVYNYIKRESFFIDFITLISCEFFTFLYFNLFYYYFIFLYIKFNFQKII